MSAESNRALIQRFYDEGWNANDLDVYEELVSPDFVDHQALPGQPCHRESRLEPGEALHRRLGLLAGDGPLVGVDRQHRGTEPGRGEELEPAGTRRGEDEAHGVF